MSPLAEPPAVDAPPKRRGLPALLSPDPDRRALQIGVIGTIVVHIILLLLVPHLLKLEPVRSVGRPHANPQQFSIEIAPDTFSVKPPPSPPPPMKYVEANPNAPENPPDKTNNFSFMNQQVAQPKPTPNGHSEMPTTQGRKNLAETQIVTGTLHKPEPPQTPAPPVPPAVPRPASSATARREEIPLPGFEKERGQTLEGYATNTQPLTPEAQPVPNKVEGQKNVPLIENAPSFAPQIDPLHPQPRRTLDQNVRPAVFAENKFGTPNVGVIAVDARFNEYGVYLNKMAEAVQAEWDRLLDNSGVDQTSACQVQISFVINSKGQIASIHVDPASGASGASDALARSCVGAIANPAPYGPWTPDMIAMLGQQQTLIYQFFYGE